MQCSIFRKDFQECMQFIYSTSLKNGVKSWNVNILPTIHFKKLPDGISLAWFLAVENWQEETMKPSHFVWIQAKLESLWNGTLVPRLVKGIREYQPWNTGESFVSNYLPFERINLSRTTKALAGGDSYFTLFCPSYCCTPPYGGVAQNFTPSVLVLGEQRNKTFVLDGSNLNHRVTLEVICN